MRRSTAAIVSSPICQTRGHLSIAHEVCDIPACVKSAALLEQGENSLWSAARAKRAPLGSLKAQKKRGDKLKLEFINGLVVVQSIAVLIAWCA